MVSDCKNYYPITYNGVFEIAKHYANLGEHERIIIEYLFNMTMFDGGCLDLAKAVNISVDNVRKTLAKLQHMGLVYVYRYRYDEDGEVGYGGMAHCFLVAGWMEQLCRLDESEILNGTSRI